MFALDLFVFPFCCSTTFHFVPIRTKKACVDEKVIAEIRISKRRYRFQFYINHLHIWPRNLDGIVVSIFVYILV